MTGEFIHMTDENIRCNSYATTCELVDEDDHPFIIFRQRKNNEDEEDEFKYEEILLTPATFREFMIALGTLIRGTISKDEVIFSSERDQLLSFLRDNIERVQEIANWTLQHGDDNGAVIKTMAVYILSELKDREVVLEEKDNEKEGDN